MLKLEAHQTLASSFVTQERGEFVAYTLAGDAAILAAQLAGLDQPLDIATHCVLRLRGVLLHPLSHAVEELRHVDPGCARQRSNPVTKEKHEEIKGAKKRAYLGRAGRVTISPELQRRQGGDGGHEMRTREP